MRPGRIHEEFPAPSYRGYQEQALNEIATAFADGARIVLVRAPTGSGKSLLARAICGCARRPSEGTPHQVTGAYYTTPQVSQLDAVAEDSLLTDIAIIRGKRNYSCALPDEPDTPVDRAPCVRDASFDCQIVHRCPYFADREIAQNKPIAGMTLAYFMQTAGSGVFGQRDVVVVDEAHGLADWAEMYATIELSPRTVPVWGDLHVPTVTDDPESVLSFAESVVARCKGAQSRIEAKPKLSVSEVARLERLRDIRRELEWFISDYSTIDSSTTWVTDQRDDDVGAIEIKPLNPARFLHRTVWDRGSRFALLSATILDKQSFCHGAGLPPSDVALIDVPHTFPLDHRPLFDVTQGKMTQAHRGETLPAIARTIARIMAYHPDEKGIIHCHSYAIQRELRSKLTDFGVESRIIGHDRETRDGSLADWLHRDDPAVFLSVTMEEALDLQGDKARWQVLCKAPFPNIGDPAVAARLEAGDWAWYNRRTLRTVIQACGRVVRSPDDYGATYLADSSLLDVFERTRSVMPTWFREQVDQLTTPELPPFDAQQALAGSGSSSSTSKERETNRQPSTRGHPLSDVWKSE